MLLKLDGRHHLIAKLTYDDRRARRIGCGLLVAFALCRQGYQPSELSISQRLGIEYGLLVTSEITPAISIGDDLL
jgi:hypothetical protein